MSKHKSKKTTSAEDSEGGSSEASWSNISQAFFNSNNGNSTFKQEDTKVPVEYSSNTMFEKGLTIENTSAEGWKLNEISGDDMDKTPRDSRFSKPRNKKEQNFEHPIKPLDVKSPFSGEPQQDIQLCQSNFNYPHQSIVASYLSKKYTLQTSCQGDQDVLKRAMCYLHKNWIHQTMCDALISTKDGDILTHQLVLAAHSPTLETIFEKNKKPLPQLIQISMTDYSRDIISDVLNYLYTSNIKVDCKNIALLIAISRQLDFPEIINKCGVFLTKSYNHDNVFLHFSVAANNHMKNSKNYLLKVIALNFSLLCQHNHFLYIPFQRLEEIISHESLAAEELEVLLALIKWFDFNRTERLQHSEALFSKVKFEQINPELIANQVEVHDWLFNNKANKNFLAQAYKFHALAAVGETSKPCKKTASLSNERNDDNSSTGFNADTYNDNQANNNNNKRGVRDRIKARVSLRDMSERSCSYSSGDSDFDEIKSGHEINLPELLRKLSALNSSSNLHNSKNKNFEDFSQKLNTFGKSFNKKKVVNMTSTTTKNAD